MFKFFSLVFVSTITITVAAVWPASAVDCFSFLGGGQRDTAYHLVLDDQDNVIVVGLTRSATFPVTTGVYNQTFSGGDNDLFVVKLSPNLDLLLASTFIGGTDHDGAEFLADPYQQTDNVGPNIILDENGSILITGSTLSTDFPTTPGAYNTVHNGLVEDAFLLRLSADLTTLLDSTLFGGEHKDYGRTLLVEPTGKIIVGGGTRSQDFPVTIGAYDTSYNGAERDIFLLRFDAEMTTIEACTYFGGNDEDFNRTLLRNDSGDLFISGLTESSNLPTTIGAFDPIFNGGGRDVFVARFSSDLSTLQACTYFGGHDWGEPFHGGEHEGGCDEVYGMCFESQGNLVVVGTSHSVDFPITAGAHDTVFNDGVTQHYDGMAAVFSPDLSTLLHSTYIGGRHMDKVFSVALDSSGYLVMAGGSHSLDFPVTPDAFDSSYAGVLEGFLVRMSPDLSDIVYSTVLGGSNYDLAYDLAVDSSGQAVVLVGYSFSDDMQIVSGGFDDSYDGESDAFVFKLDLPEPSTDTIHAGLTCIPESGTLPFSTWIATDLVNLTDYFRVAAANLDLRLPGGQFYSNFRRGSTGLDAAEFHRVSWNQQFPELVILDGTTTFELHALDVTPAPYNQPPFPSSGSMSTDQCLVPAVLP